MKIATITLNPAIDRSIVYSDDLKVGELNRVEGAKVNAGGKGINVSRMLKILGKDSYVYGFGGGRCGRMLEDMLSDEGIKSELTQTLAETRMNIKITDKDSKETEINEVGGPITDEEFSKLKEVLKKSTADIFIIGGSCPRGLNDDTTRILAEMLKVLGKKVIVDTSGKQLVNAVLAKPYLIKPNREEFCQLLGFTPKDDEYEKCAVDYYNKTGIEIVLTLGKSGAVYSGRAGNYRIINPEVKPKGFTGAGDTFLASFIYALCEDMDIRTALKFASSASMSKVTLEGTALPDRELIDSNLEKIKVLEI